MTKFLFFKYLLLMIVVTGTLYVISVKGGRAVYPLLVAVMLASFIYMVVAGDGAGPSVMGVLYGLLVGPFWGMFHIIFAISASKENLGNEVSLAGTGMTVGMTLGFLGGGFMAEYVDSGLVIMAGFLCVLVATFLLIGYCAKMRLKNLLRETGALDETWKGALVRCRYRSIGSIFEGYFNMASGNLWIVFMSLHGITAAIVGVWNALMVVVKIIFTPFAGSLVNHGQRREMMLGTAINAAGWIPLLFTNLFVVPSMYIWSVGNQLYATGLTSAWYSTRTVASLMVREVILGITRVCVLLLLTPVLYADRDLFVMITVIVSLLMVVYAMRWIRNIKLRGPVMPIENKIMSD